MYITDKIWGQLFPTIEKGQEFITREDLEKGIENNIAIRKLADEGVLRPYVCKEFSLEEAKKSIEFLSERKLIGKVVINME